jgi:magnesium chelatase subunit I
MPSIDFVHQISHLVVIKEDLDKLIVFGNQAAFASAVEFVLEGLHLNRKLNKDMGKGPAKYHR